MSDSLTPNPWQVDPVTGALVYERIELYAGATLAEPPDERRVRWIRESDSALVADLFAFDVSGTQRATWRVDNPDGNGAAQLDLETDGGVGEVRALTSDPVVGATIITSLGQSSFLQLAAIDERKIAIGTGTVTITNGTNDVSGAIAHGLGVTPAVVLATARMTADTRDDYIATVASRGVTNLTFRVRGGAAESFPLANPTVVTFDWIAIG